MLLESAYTSIIKQLRTTRTSGIVRAEAFIEPVDIWAWLVAHPHDIRIYWAERDGRFEAACLGAAHMVRASALEKVRFELERAEGRPRYYGGIEFAPNGKEDSEWQAFGSQCFVLPQLEITRQDDRYTLACNVYHDEKSGDGLERTIHLLENACQPVEPAPGAFPHIQRRNEHPNREQWLRSVIGALNRISKDQFEKVVLARRTDIIFDVAVDPWAFMTKLQAVSNGAYRFVFQFAPGTAFLGASPERLYRREGRELVTEAVAGTRPRGSAPEADADLADALIHSDKDRREHAFVIEGMKRALADVAESVNQTEDIGIRSLANCHHLSCVLTARLKTGINDADLIKTLHPSAAVGGYPTKPALEYIQSVEPFARRWYAGPVGWISRDAAEFAVAIRSALATGPTMMIYAGAGIVNGSVPEAEWDEMEQKLSGFLSVLRENFV